MFRWILKRCGRHVCEFTSWQTCEMVFRRPATPDERADTGMDRVTYVVRWQRRRCTVCGKDEVREHKIFT